MLSLPKIGGRKPGAPLDRRVGMGEEGRVGDRHAEHLEERVLVGDVAGLLVVGHLLGGDLPERRLVGVLADRAGRIDRLVHLGAGALDPAALGCGEQRIVLEARAQLARDAVAQVAAEHDAIGVQHLAGRLDQGDVAERLDAVGALVVTHRIGKQAALAAQDLDLALGHDDIVGLEADLPREHQHRAFADVQRLPRRHMREQHHGQCWQ